MKIQAFNIIGTLALGISLAFASNCSAATIPNRWVTNLDDATPHTKISTLVDGVNGNDSTGRTNDWTWPFKTIQAANTAMSGSGAMRLVPGQTFSLGTNTIIITNMIIEAWGATINRIQSNNISSHLFRGTIAVEKSLQLYGGLFDSTTSTNFYCYPIYLDVGCTNLLLVNTEHRGITDAIYAENCVRGTFNLFNVTLKSQWDTIALDNCTNCVVNMNGCNLYSIWRPGAAVDTASERTSVTFYNSAISNTIYVAGGIMDLEDTNATHSVTLAALNDITAGPNTFFLSAPPAVIQLTNAAGLASIHGFDVYDPSVVNVQGHPYPDFPFSFLGQNVVWLGDEIAGPDIGVGSPALGGGQMFLSTYLGDRRWAWGFNRTNAYDNVELGTNQFNIWNSNGIGSSTSFFIGVNSNGVIKNYHILFGP